MIRLIVVFLSIWMTTACTYMGFTDLEPEALKKEYADDFSHFADIQGVQLHYRDEGNADAPVLVLLHGIMASLHTWDGWVSELKNDFRIIRVDIPGFGLTGPYPDGIYNIDKSVEMVDLLMKQLDIDTFFLAGNSMGGYISWNYALAHPEKVERLILLDSAGHAFDPPMILALLDTPVLQDSMAYVTPRFVVSQTVREVYGDADKVTDPVIDRYHRLMLREGNREAVVDVFASLQEADPSGIKDVEVPVLIMWGELDRWIPPEHALRFRDQIDDAELIMYPGAGHIPMEEIPQKTASDARDFFMSVIDQQETIAPEPVKAAEAHIGKEG